MKLTFVLIDDDVYVHSDVRRRLSKIPNLNMVAAFTGVQDALDYFFIHEEGVDIVLCDILMPDIDGYEAAELLYGYYDMLLFLTGKTEHGEEVFGSPALGYLKKPVNASQVMEKLNQLAGLPRTGVVPKENPGIVILNDRKSGILVKVNTAEIQRIEISNRMATVHTVNDGPGYLITESMRTILRHLKSTGDFIRISSREVIAVSAVRSISSDMVIQLTDGTLCGVSETFKPAARAFFRRWQLG